MGELGWGKYVGIKEKEIGIQIIATYMVMTVHLC